MSSDRLRRSYEKYAPVAKESKVEDLISQFEEYKTSSRRRFSSRFDELTYCPRNVEKAKIPLACMKMFDDLGFLNMINEEELARDTNCCILLIAAICHDVDHRALTNPYLMEQRGREHGSIVSRASVKDSVQERHHFYVTENVLGREGCEILKSLKTSMGKKLSKIKRLLLTTDASMDKFKDHISIFKELSDNVKEQDHINSFYRDNDALIMDLIISCADLSDQVKDFENAREAACLVLKEFYDQGDKERKEGKPVLDIYKRDSPVYKGQIFFFQNMVLPLFLALKVAFPESRRLYRNGQKNLEMWSTDEFKSFKVQ
ncbi:DgyrCDS13455 [Dimorphilus gyrociliatus]|uniref:DgyrCDS13455 n=1 Tax=Dimorphilus gyrociliatus TaxID=2664684 RepID=A0A7I8WAP7_9ANNE|nr:DgyrCDS13455 [Dimorphilus gyrociliatus]